MKLVLYLLLLTFSVFYTAPASANLHLDISIIRKMGIDKGLVLESEFHTTEIIVDNGFISLSVMAGMKLNLQIQIGQDPETYGPSTYLKLVGEIIDENGNVLHAFLERPIFMNTAEKRKVDIKVGPSQLIEMSLFPHHGLLEEAIQGSK